VIDARASWEALGTRVIVQVGERASLAPARAAVEREIEAIDRACSRFRDDSELSRVNASAGRTHRISALLAEALALALRAAALTDGDVDPTIGRALELAGYDRDWSLIAGGGDGAPVGTPAQAPLGTARAANRPASVRLHTVRARARSGWRAVELDAQARTLRVPAGVRLDVGATAKAWVADRAARAAADAYGCGVLVGVGGDIGTAGDCPADGWRIRVTDDHRSDPSAPGQTIAIRSGGIATSSTTVRRWHAHGQEQHHIIDPATGEAADSCWRTVTVAAADCAQANIAATAAIVRGPPALAWLEQLGLPARLVDDQGVVRTVAGWPADVHVANVSVQAPRAHARTDTRARSRGRARGTTAEALA
jgi:FAD:protein FMN transferase